MKAERLEQVSPIFRQALEVSTDERAAFLETACAGDTVLRHDVEQLLSAHERAGSFIDSPAYEKAAVLLADKPADSLVGQLITHYRIVAPLGKGGMGEIWRASDTRLDREVAIKLLPASFANDPDSLRRFEQEARATSALNHPNILTIYDIGTTAAESGGVPYIVAELLDGEELRAQLGDGPLPVRSALDYAQQIAQGLAAAHEKGIVHRDLKPENLFVTRDGRVKILDFGIAKLKPSSLPGGVDSEALTRKPLTMPGMVMGTVGYMAPEQVRGHEADHRSDIFAFGVILYEMLAGRRAFHHETMAETMTAILKEEPAELSEANVKVGPGLEKIVRRCLEKKPERRFQSTHDLAFAIEASSTTSNSQQSPILPLVVQEQGRADKLRVWAGVRLPWIVAGVLLVGLLAALPFAAGYFGSSPEQASVVRFTLPLPEKVTAYTDVETHNLSVSPDGSHVAFIATAEGQRMLWVRGLDSLSAQALPGTEGAFSPFWSPDSRFIAFFAEGKLKKVGPGSGAPQTICEVSVSDNMGTWGPDGTILFSGGAFLFSSGAEPGNIYRVNAAGGQPSLLLKTEQTIAYWFHFLPDGRHFLYYGYNRGASEPNGVYVGSLDSTAARLLLPLPQTSVQYAPPGYLLYVRESTLMAHPFDAQSLRFTGEPQPVVEGLGYFIPSGWSEFSVSENGVLVYMPRVLTTRLVWLDRSGREAERLIGAPGDYYSLALSPDGQKVAYSMSDPRTGSGDLWVHDLARDTRTRFTFGPGDDDSFVWSPDGRRAAFFSVPKDAGKSTFHIKDLSDAGDGTSPLQPGFQSPSDWSPDGRFIIYTQNPPTMNSDLWVLPMFGDGKPFPFLQTQFHERHARFSPDGRWVSFVSNESGQTEVYVARFDNPREKWRISTSGGLAPRWRRDGKELFYISLDERMMSASIKAGDKFEVGVSTPLFKAALAGDYAVTADGQRFLVTTNATETQSAPFNVVLNWSASLTKGPRN